MIMIEIKIKYIALFFLIGVMIVINLTKKK